MAKPLLHIKKLENGKFQYTFEKARVDGKRNRAYGTYDTEDEAWLEGRKAYNLYYENGITSKENMTYYDLVVQWIKMDCENRISESTIEGYKKRFRNYIFPYIGDKYLNTILSMHLNNLVVTLNNKGISRNSLTNVKALLTSTFRFATVNRFINYDPSYNLRLPTERVKTAVKTREKPHHFLSDMTMYGIFNLIKDNPMHYLIIKIGYECGLRRAEIFGLFWNDIDFTHRTMTIRRQMQYSQDHTRTRANIKANNGTRFKGDGFWYYKLPKYDSIRKIKISDELCNLLRDYKRLNQKNRLNKDIKTVYNYVNEYPDEACKFSKITQNPNDIRIDPIFVKENGEYETPNMCMYLTQKIHKAGFKDFDMHSLRKTHSTILQNNGFNIKYVADRLGHTDVKTTTEVYYELSNKVLEEQNNKLTELYDATSKQGLMEGTIIVTVKEIIEENQSSEIDDAKSSEVIKKMDETDW